MAKEIHENGVELLTTAIVKRAVEDIKDGFPYVDWSKDKVDKIKKASYASSVRRRIRDSEDAKRFLRSEWFHAMFPNIDGNYLIELAEKEGRDRVEKEREKDEREGAKIKLMRNLLRDFLRDCFYRVSRLRKFCMPRNEGGKKIMGKKIEDIMFGILMTVIVIASVGPSVLLAIGLILHYFGF